MSSESGEIASPSIVRTALLCGFASAVTGFWFGVNAATWQVAVETAQVWAGLIEYDPDNAFYRYHMTAWTAIHHICAGLLSMGVSERALSIVLSGALPAATLSALTVFCYSLCRSPSIAIAAPLAYFTLFGLDNAYGISYPIFLTGTHHTYGLLGRAVALWILALGSIGAYRPAAVLVGFAPALHLTWGVYGIGIAGLAWLLADRDWKGLSKLLPWFAAGASFSLASLGYQYWATGHLPEVDMVLAESIRSAFLEHWDGHRAPAPLVSPGMLLLLIGLAVSAAMWLRGIDKDNSGARVAIAAVLTGSATGIAVLLLTHSGDLLPRLLLAAMPGRFANLAIMLVPVFLIGVLWRLTNPFATFAVTFGLVYVLWNWVFLAWFSSDRFGWSLDHWKMYLFLGVVAFVILCRPLPIFNSEAVTGLKEFRKAFGAAAWGIAACALFMISVPDQTVAFRAMDPAIGKAGAREGLLIAGPGMELMQLRTGRPLLLNTGGLDQLSYHPDTGPAMNAALKLVYGVDILNPPAYLEEHRSASLRSEASRAVFESRSWREWQVIARELHPVRVDVLVPANWELKAPLVAESDAYRLYGVLVFQGTPPRAP